MTKIIHLLFAALCATTGASVFAHDEKFHEKVEAIKQDQKDWGIAGDAKAVTQTIAINMDDNMRFTPAHIDLTQGQTVKFIVTNAGKVLHEMVIDTAKNLEEHAAMMLKFPDMLHDEAYMTHVAPGKTEALIWTFNRAGTFDFACLIAGHYQAGMTGKIKVTAAP